MKYNLLGKYFVDKNSYFEGLKEKANVNYQNMLNKFKLKIPYYTQSINNTFKREISNKGMLNKYYLNAEKNIEKPENNTINKSNQIDHCKCKVKVNNQKKSILRWQEE